MSALFIHYEIEPAALQPSVPFELDVRDGKAYVSLVAFQQEKLRFEFGGRLTAFVGARAANHPFLNLRTYVRVGEERGIYFIAEWVPNRLASWIAPPMFGLPYRLGELDLERGVVRSGKSQFQFRRKLDKLLNDRLEICLSLPGGVDEFLLERYVAFTCWRGRRRFFRVAHEPWTQRRVEVAVEDDSLLRAAFSWWGAARLAGANFSPGATEVRIGRPQRMGV